MLSIDLPLFLSCVLGICRSKESMCSRISTTLLGTVMNANHHLISRQGNCQWHELALPPSGPGCHSRSYLSPESRAAKLLRHKDNKP